LTQIVADLKAHFESVETTAKQFLDEHVPELVERAQQAEANPLIAAVEAAVHLPDSVKVLAADFITKLAAEFPPPPPEPEPEQPPA
jgi:hypothetical protein